MSTRGFEQVIQGITDLEQDIIEGLFRGLVDGAEALEADAKATSAYSGMSGATRASTTAYAVGPGHNSTSKIDQARDTAASLLDGFEGHDGKPFLEEKPGPDGDSLMVVLTVPTSYANTLETARGGEKSFIGPEMDKHAGSLFEAANRGVRQVLK